MKTIYTANIVFYSFMAGVGSLFSSKARKWVKGRQGWRRRLRTFIKEGKKVVWMHCASLGEFKKGRPVIEKIRREQPEWKVVLTFFSPSGYEVRKDYRGADLIMYLPSDLPVTVRYFLDKTDPDLDLLVKYEFWYNYLHALRRGKTRTYLVSCVFRPTQYLFRWYGALIREVFSLFTHVFVQDEQSGLLLKGIGFERYSVTGDTRFDRVSQIAEASRDLPAIERFRGGERLFVAGSGWEDDEDIIIRYINEHPTVMKWIIAPHEVDKAHLQRIEKKISVASVRYSALDPADDAGRVMIIDNIGMLSSVYRYASMAAVGGGFGKGIHNILEPACWVIPVLFGPNHGKFREAADLTERGGAFTFDSFDTFAAAVNKYLTDSAALTAAGAACASYIAHNKGATDKV